MRSLMRHEFFSRKIGSETIRAVMRANGFRTGIIVEINANSVKIRDFYSLDEFEVVGDGVYEFLWEGLIIHRA